MVPWLLELFCNGTSFLLLLLSTFRYLIRYTLHHCCRMLVPTIEILILSLLWVHSTFWMHMILKRSIGGYYVIPKEKRKNAPKRFNPKLYEVTKGNKFLFNPNKNWRSSRCTSHINSLRAPNLYRIQIKNGVPMVLQNYVCVF